MIFEYAAHKTFMGMIDVVDIGNMCLRCTQDGGAAEWYLLTKTIMGKVSILTFGPVNPDVPMLLDGFAVNYQKIDYKENLISRNVTTFLNDPKKKISEVEELVDFAVWQKFPDIETLFNEV